MAVKIRLRQQGKTNRQTYRLVVTDGRTRRDGKYIEMLGSYDPFKPEANCTVHADRMQHWLGLGAEMSPQVEALLGKEAPEVLKIHREQKEKKRTQNAAKRRALRAAKRTA